MDLEDNRFGMICATIASIFSKKKYKPNDFFRRKQPRKQSVEDMANFLERFTLDMGGVVNG